MAIVPPRPPRRSSWAPALAIACACAWGEGGTDRPTSTIADDTSNTGGATESSGGAETGGDDGSGACVPGQQIACPCPGGAEGAQACNAAGTGYLPCECPDDDADSGGPSTSSGSSDGPDTGNGATTDPTGQCGGEEQCDLCVECGVDDPCKEQYAECISDATCAAAAECVFACGFNPDCGMKCAPTDNSEGAILYAELADCLTITCPQCGGG
jgi:hypothetical protein